MEGNMHKMSQQQKIDTYGGVGPMMIWVIMIGAVMAVQTITSTALSVIDAVKAPNDTSQAKSSSTRSSSSSYLRLSPMPARSAIGMWF
jgi:hypothetical protein